MCLATLPVFLLIAGCSGINTTHSVSPASFFLPGLLQADPPATLPDTVTPTAASRNQLAQAN
jgi:hypothetical protein